MSQATPQQTLRSTGTGTTRRTAARRHRRTGSAAAATRQLRKTFRGPLHLPGDPGYDDQRQTWSGALDAHPALIAEATTAQDVRAAVLAARDNGLRLVVQGTGHGTLVAADGALLLKTGRLADVSIDPEWEIARVGAGAAWADVIAAAAPYGLVPVSGDTASVGVAGFTLGGGIGWLSRKYGFAADNLLRAEAVTAAGRHVAASASRHSDLFWALRGGGANFGAVTALELRLHRVPRVHGGVAWFPLDRAAATLAGYRTWALTAQPRELTTSIVLHRDGAAAGIDGPAMAVRILYAGEASDAERALRGLHALTGAPVAGGYRTTPYERADLGGTPPRRFELLADLPDDAIAAALALVDREHGSANAVQVRCWDGAIADAGPDAAPVGHRDVPFAITIDGPPEQAEALAAHATGGSFLNFLRDQDRTAAAYTPASWDRLRTLKRALDPSGLFGATHRIPPREE